MTDWSVICVFILNKLFLFVKIRNKILGLEPWPHDQGKYDKTANKLDETGF
jgi:hypothetical protein